MRFVRDEMKRKREFPRRLINCLILQFDSRSDGNGRRLLHSISRFFFLLLHGWDISHKKSKEKVLIIIHRNINNNLFFCSFHLLCTFVLASLSYHIVVSKIYFSINSLEGSFIFSARWSQYIAHGMIRTELNRIKSNRTEQTRIPCTLWYIYIYILNKKPKNKLKIKKHSGNLLRLVRFCIVCLDQ